MSGKKGRKCSMINCDSYQHTHKHLSFFRFPKDPERCKLWIDESGRPDLAHKSAVYEDRICQLHFATHMFLNDCRNRLHQSAVPSRHLITGPTAPSQTGKNGRPPSSAGFQDPGDSSTPPPPMKRARHSSSSSSAKEWRAAAATPKSRDTANNNGSSASPANVPAVPSASAAAAPNAANSNATQEAYIMAAHEVRSSGMAYRKAADKYGVDSATLKRFCGRLAKTIGEYETAMKTMMETNAAALAASQPRSSAPISSPHKANGHAEAAAAAAAEAEETALDYRKTNGHADVGPPSKPELPFGLDEQTAQQLMLQQQQLLLQKQIEHHLLANAAIVAAAAAAANNSAASQASVRQTAAAMSDSTDTESDAVEMPPSNGSSFSGYEPYASIGAPVAAVASAASAAAAAAAAAANSKRPRMIFSGEQEDQLAHYVRETSDYYNGLTSKDVRTLAFVYAVCNGVDIPHNWRELSEASADWCVGFIKRNKLGAQITGGSLYGKAPAQQQQHQQQQQHHLQQQQQQQQQPNGAHQQQMLLQQAQLQQLQQLQLLQQQQQLMAGGSNGSDV